MPFLRRQSPKNMSPFAAPIAEALERRRLLSAGINKRVLTLAGTEGADTISLSLRPGQPSQFAVTVNQQVSFFSRQGVLSIRINAGGGNDSVRIVETGGSLAAAVQIAGGGGNDTLVGSSLNDVIAGGSGNDQLYGGLGNDTVDGGSGNDALGGDEEDRFAIVGRADPKPVVGNDLLRGGAGNDWLLGGTQTDMLIPGSNRNGSARFAFANGRDTLVGGPGRDILDARGGDDTIPDRGNGDIVPSQTYTNDPNATAYVVHEHIVLRVYLGGAIAQIPVGFGEFSAPMIHKHAGSGQDTLHLHSTAPHVFYLGEIFAAMGVSLGPDHIGQYRAGNGHQVAMTVNGAPNTQFASYRIQDDDVITLRWQ